MRSLFCQQTWFSSRNVTEEIVVNIFQRKISLLLVCVLMTAAHDMMQ